jgi:hypothetical protein
MYTEQDATSFHYYFTSTGWTSKEQGWHHHQKHHHTKLPTPMKDEPTPAKSTDQADMEGKGHNIIRVANTRGATIKVSISKIYRCTRGITRFEKKSYSEDLKIRTLTER